LILNGLSVSIIATTLVDHKITKYELRNGFENDIYRIILMNDTQILAEIKHELGLIRAHAEAQTNLISSASTYAIGYAIAFGMNWAEKEDLIYSLLMSLFSWINVGYMLVKHS